MTGILSLLDILFEMEMGEIVQGLNLTDDVTNALLDRKGPLGCLLNLVERIEVTDFDAVRPLLSQCEITLDQLLTAQLEAFNWRSMVLEQ